LGTKEKEKKRGGNGKRKVLGWKGEGNKIKAFRFYDGRSTGAYGRKKKGV